MNDQVMEAGTICGCAIVNIDLSEKDVLWVVDRASEHTNDYLVTELIEAGLRTKLPATLSAEVVAKIVSDCVADWKEQSDVLRKEAADHHKINVMLQDCALFELPENVDRTASLAQVAQYIGEINGGEHYDLFASSKPGTASDA